MTNGMSEYARDGENINGGLLVNVTPEDFGSGHPLAGIAFQRRLEGAAYRLGGGYTAPCQRVEDFLLRRPSTGCGSVRPSFRPGVRYMACVAGGMLVGLGGAVLSTGILSQFTENMTDGRGFIALAAVTFGKYTPFGTLGGVIVFGIGETLSYRLQAGGGAFPYEFALMLPYVLTVLALCVFSRNAKDPAALGVPYYKSH